MILLLVAILHAPSPVFPHVTIYREVVCASPLDVMPLALRFPQLDRPSPFTTYRNERE